MRPTPPRLFVRWFGVLSLPAIVATGVSFTRALDARGNLSLSERSVEWLRDHNFGDTVSWVEHTYYSANQPQTGGTLAAGIPHAAVSAPTTASTTTAVTAVNDSIVPIASPALPREGVWQPLGDVVQGSTAMQAAFLRPDAIHGAVLAAVVRIDQSKAMFRVVPGLQEPGGGPWTGGGALPTADMPRLLAAFNSGFRLVDSRGGFFAQARTTGQLRVGAASLVLAADGSLTIADWGRDASMANAPVAVRQNLDLIVDGGQLVRGLDDNAGDRWGKTVGNALYVWRSGIGIDAAGRILYVASEGLTVKTLAALLQRAGAVRAMELDINHSWVSFNSFHHDTAGQLQGTKLLDGMKKAANRYLGPDSRDFIGVVSRQPLVAA